MEDKALDDGLSLQPPGMEANSVIAAHDNQGETERKHRLTNSRGMESSQSSQMNSSFLQNQWNLQGQQLSSQPSNHID